jgi:hypothetical protein
MENEIVEVRTTVTHKAYLGNYETLSISVTESRLCKEAEREQVRNDVVESLITFTMSKGEEAKEDPDKYIEDL